MSPDIAVQTEFDQFFVCGVRGVSPWVLVLARAWGGREGGMVERTLEFVFAYVDGGWRVDHVGGEVVDHCWCSGWYVRKIGEALEVGNLHNV